MSSEQKLDLKQIRNDVESEIQNEGHDKIAKLCRTVLASKPNELLWLRLLCCAMLHLSQTKALLKFIETYSNKEQIYHALLLYKIYCLYLLKQNEDAHKLLVKNKDKSIGFQYLEFQIYYRLGKYESALNILSQISDRQHLHQIATNEICTLIAMDRAPDAVDKYYNKQKDASLYKECDFVFNLGTALILCDRVNDAKSFLISSITSCQNGMKEEEYEDTEIESEIANLQLLIAYCLYENGNVADAHEYYNDIKMEGIYHNLILQNNCLIMKEEYDDDNILIYNKLLSKKNNDNFSRFGGSTELMKAYHNKCIILIRNQSKRNDLEFKSMIARIKEQDPASELPLFLKISRHFSLSQYQQIKDILYHHISSNPNASTKARLYYIQILINIKKYRKAITQIRAFKDDHLKYSENSINIALDLASKLNDNELKIEMMKEYILYLRKTRRNTSLLISLEIELCHLLISLKRLKEAKDNAENLYKMEPTNNVYCAMLLLSAVNAQDMDTANKVSSEMKLDIQYDAYAVDELLVEIPSNSNTNKHFSFEIADHIELERKRKENRKKRQRNAMKLREKYEEHPLLYRDPVNWESKRERDRKERTKNNEKAKSNIRKAKNKGNQPQKNKKKQGFRGAQGGSKQIDKYDIADPKNKNKGGKTVIPHHIKKKRKRG